MGVCACVLLVREWMWMCASRGGVQGYVSTYVCELCDVRTVYRYCMYIEQ